MVFLRDAARRLAFIIIEMNRFYGDEADLVPEWRGSAG